MRDGCEIGGGIDEDKGGAADFARRGLLRGVDLAGPRLQTICVAARVVPLES